MEFPRRYRARRGLGVATGDARGDVQDPIDGSPTKGCQGDVQRSVALVRPVWLTAIRVELDGLEEGGIGGAPRRAHFADYCHGEPGCWFHHGTMLGNCCVG